MAPRTEGCLDTEELDWLGHMFHFLSEIFQLFCSASAELMLLPIHGLGQWFLGFRVNL